MDGRWAELVGIAVGISTQSWYAISRQAIISNCDVDCTSRYNDVVCFCSVACFCSVVACFCGLFLFLFLLLQCILDVYFVEAVWGEQR